MVNPPFDPDLAQLGLPQPPPLPASIDPVTIERIRRTIYVGNLNPSVSAFHRTTQILSATLFNEKFPLLQNFRFLIARVCILSLHVKRCYV